MEKLCQWWFQSLKDCPPYIRVGDLDHSRGVSIIGSNAASELQKKFGGYWNMGKEVTGVKLCYSYSSLIAPPFILSVSH